ncbi:MAG: hypothetical protein WBA76_03580 [Phormidesmis sp.]
MLWRSHTCTQANQIAGRLKRSLAKATANSPLFPDKSSQNAERP